MRLAVLSAAVLLAACASAPEAPGPVASGEWRLASLTGGPEGAPRAPTIQFEEGRAAGFAGCNRYFATVDRNGDTLTLSQIGATRMFCEGPAMQMETVFLAALSNVRSTRADAGSLTFLDGAGAELMRFTPAPAEAR